MGTKAKYYGRLSSLAGFILSQVTVSMISVRYASIIAVAAFVSGSFVTSPELRVYAANTVFSADIVDGQVKTADLANNAVTTVKIKDGEVKNADLAPSSVGSLKIKDNDIQAIDIAADAVGASEISGVSRLIFAECDFSPGNELPSGIDSILNCGVSGAHSGDNVIATSNEGCLAAVGAASHQGAVAMTLVNVCNYDMPTGTYPISIIVYNN